MTMTTKAKAKGDTTTASLVFSVVFALLAGAAVVFVCLRRIREAKKAVGREGFFFEEQVLDLDDMRQRKVSAEDRIYQADLRGRVGEPDTLNEGGQALVRRMVDERQLHSERPACTIAGVRLPLKWRPDGKEERVCRLSAAYAGAERCKRDNADLFDANVLEDISFDNVSQRCRLKFKEGLSEADMRAYKQKVDPFAAKEKRKRELRAEKARLQGVSDALAADIQRLKAEYHRLHRKVTNLRYNLIKPYEGATERLLAARKFPGSLKMDGGRELSLKNDEGEFGLLVFDKPGEYGLKVEADVVTLDVLVVAGGGSGGVDKGGGGGAGGVTVARNFMASKGFWKIRVGKGGKTPNSQTAVGLRGEDSYFGIIAAIGGGGGGCAGKPPTTTGGSGGGGRYASNNFYKYGKFQNEARDGDGSIEKLSTDSKEACADICAENDECMAMVFRVKDGRCFLKSASHLNHGQVIFDPKDYRWWQKVDSRLLEGGRASAYRVGYPGVETFGNDGSMTYGRTPYPGGGGAGGGPSAQGSGGKGKSFADVFGTEVGDEGWFGGGGSGQPEKGVNETGGKGGGGHGRVGSVGGAGKPGTGGGGGGVGKGDGENGGGSGVVIVRYKKK